MSIKEYRRDRPEYDDLNDNELVGALYNQSGRTDVDERAFGLEMGVQPILSIEEIRNSKPEYADLTPNEIAQAYFNKNPNNFKTLEDYKVKMGIEVDSKAESFGRGVVEGATLGLVDEVGGFFGAVKEQISSTKPGADLVEVYKEDRDRMRSSQNKSREDNPGTFLAGEISSGIATGVGGLAAAGAKQGIKTGVRKSSEAGMQKELKKREEIFDDILAGGAKTTDTKNLKKTIELLDDMKVPVPAGLRKKVGKLEDVKSVSKAREATIEARDIVKVALNRENAIAAVKVGGIYGGATALGGSEGETAMDDLAATASGIAVGATGGLVGYKLAKMFRKDYDVDEVIAGNKQNLKNIKDYDEIVNTPGNKNNALDIKELLLDHELDYIKKNKSMIRSILPSDVQPARQGWKQSIKSTAYEGVVIAGSYAMFGGMGGVIGIFVRSGARRTLRAGGKKAANFVRKLNNVEISDATSSLQVRLGKIKEAKSPKEVTKILNDVLSTREKIMLQNYIVETSRQTQKQYTQQELLKFSAIYKRIRGSKELKNYPNAESLYAAMGVLGPGIAYVNMLENDPDFRKHANTYIKKHFPNHTPLLKAK